MNFPRIQVVGLVAIILGITQPAYADHWGTDEDAQVCEKEYSDSQKWQNLNKYPYAINDALKRGQVSPQCKAEIEKRAKRCMDDPLMRGIYNDASNENPHKDPPGYCSYRAFGEIYDQLMNVPVMKEFKAAKAKQAEEKTAKKAAEEAAKVAAAEMPKASWKNPAIEKMITAAFKRDWTSGEKLLKLFLTGKQGWQIDRNALGIITGRSVYAAAVYKKGDKCTVHSTYWVQQHDGNGFSGPLEEHGAGAEENANILCAKVK